MIPTPSTRRCVGGRKRAIRTPSRPTTGVTASRVLRRRRRWCGLFWERSRGVRSRTSQTHSIVRVPSKALSIQCAWPVASFVRSGHRESIAAQSCARPGASSHWKSPLADTAFWTGFDRQNPPRPNASGGVWDVLLGHRLGAPPLMPRRPRPTNPNSPCLHARHTTCPDVLNDRGSARRLGALSAAVPSETPRVVGFEVGVTLSKSITWPARGEQLFRQVGIEQQVSDLLRDSHEPVGQTLCLA